MFTLSNQLISKLTHLLIMMFISSSIFAQAPEKMSYQAVIRNATNNLITNTVVGMQISILQGTASGTAVYVETQTPTTNANGLVSIEIGGGTVVSGAFSTINWANGPYFIKTETDPTGGTNYTITGTSQLLSVPYALYAASSGSSIPGPQGPQGPQGPAGTGGFTHYIGEAFGGGVIFHLWKDNAGVEHGLIVALTNQSTGAMWSNISNTLIGATAQSSWDGLSNSNAIVSQAGHTSSAAKLCLDLVSGGQSDWYLPAIDELSLLWNNRFNVNKTLSTIAGATVLPLDADYWSSTEGNATDVFNFYFQFGGADIYLKSDSYYVRAVRAF